MRPNCLEDIARQRILRFEAVIDVAFVPLSPACGTVDSRCAQKPEAELRRHLTPH